MSARPKKPATEAAAEPSAQRRAVRLNLIHARAAMLVAAVRDIRYYLNGLLVEVRGPRVRIVGCDGHRMVVAQSEVEQGADFDLIIPGDVMRMVLRVKRPKGFDVATLEECQDGEWFIRVCNLAFGFKPIEGSFPKYEKVIPKKTSGAAAQFNGMYVADMMKAAAILAPGGHWLTTVIHHNGDGPALVALPGDAIGVLMPMRAAETPLPKWLAEIQSEVSV